MTLELYSDIPYDLPYKGSYKNILIAPIPVVKQISDGILENGHALCGFVANVKNSCPFIVSYLSFPPSKVLSALFSSSERPYIKCRSRNELTSFN